MYGHEKREEQEKRKIDIVAVLQTVSQNCRDIFQKLSVPTASFMKNDDFENRTRVSSFYFITYNFYLFTRWNFSENFKEPTRLLITPETRGGGARW